MFLLWSFCGRGWQKYLYFACARGATAGNERGRRNQRGGGGKVERLEAASIRPHRHTAETQEQGSGNVRT